MKILTLIAAIALAGCGPALAGQTSPAGSTPAATSAATGAAARAGVTASAQAGPAGVSAATDDYRLGVADKVRILIFDEPSLSGEFLVNANGKLSLPLIGDVEAAGVTTTALAATIQRKLADGYLREPRVSIDVLTFRPFYILGEVNKPGEYPYSSGLTVLNAVATAEGFTYRASKKSVVVKHAGEADEETVPLSPDLRVRPGDTIRIKERLF
ncbi:MULTISPECIES: polysaccharide biosynthesis/export family protein [Sphingomonas]|uniref:Polysaccharide biosynthesis/export family protein n=1 Tax=Sphingomonas kyungheensis TaxID=1069987 RepID=A0ABU8H4E6_9SPHN|nr:polysaccharide biosynthesis/export family protein [Sphingomonas sp. RIT328]EZP53378.1 Polysaccharide biosynthesis/export family protein [Sphingomonas sp. RIT328]